MKNIKANIILAAVFLLFGFLAAMQMKSVINNNSTTVTEESLRANELSEELLNEKKKNESLTAELENYRVELETFREEAANSGTYAKALTAQLERAEMLAGMVAVTGPGVKVTINDSTLPSGTGVSDNNYVVHAADMLEIINELRDAGAEAIMVNGERLLATSEIRCSGSTISVNNNRYGAPFEVVAIGNSDTLESALKIRGGVVDNLSYWGIEVLVEKNENLLVNAFSGMLNFKYATAVESE